MKETIDLARNIRINSLKMAHRSNASHIGSAFSITDIVAVLYGKILKVNPNQPKWEDRDRFILSKGHACMAVYAALASLGFFPAADLEEYASNQSDLMSHISHKVKGVEFSTGSLGHGLPFGTGKALAARKMDKSWKTFVLMSDGELDEGSNWEAMMFAAHHALDNLIAIIDYNKLQSLTSIENTISLEPLVDKIKAFGWAVVEVDGHDHDLLANYLQKTPFESGKPSLIVAHTLKGKGVSFMENKVEWHYKSPNAEQLAKALEEIKNA